MQNSSLIAPNLYEIMGAREGNIKTSTILEQELKTSAKWVWAKLNNSEI